MNKTVKYVAGIGIAVLLLWVTEYYGARVKEFGHTVSTRYLDGEMTAERLDDIRKVQQEKLEKEEMPQITGWSRGSMSKVEGETLGKSAEAEIISVWGDMKQVFWGELTCGSWAVKEDSAGCVISTHLSELLYGTAQGVENRLIYQGNSYTVRGVVEQQEALFLFQDKEGRFSNVELFYERKDYPASQAKAFLNANGLGNYSGFFEGNLYAGAAGITMLLPFWTMLLWGVGWVKKTQLPEGQKAKKMMLVLAAILVAALLFHGFVSFSEDYIPSSMSDFSFWSQKWEEIQANRQSLLEYAPWLKEGKVFQCLTKSAAGALVFFLYLWGVRAVKVFQ